ncbi:cell division protein FtsZ [Niabella pedocola]|uniref:Cell division protein FtsZ n=1 Tax=Niabella pedocola TaxID=1752077 RepID=A0ABS8PQI5_9BACT|nr:cell division protein FtsZ [Niabella pedocola]MCD2423339.1 cell division protein FtsZ [Niabella pedocola]
MIHFDLPKEQSSIIKVIGVGGGGGNAVNHMFSQNIDGVNFIICNTDAQALSNSQIPNRIQLGPQLTSGLGAGANPEIGRQATEESLEEIKRIVEVNTKMAFITAGMGGGTGTGGAPIIAKICKDLGVLTVGIVTMPFAYEGKKRHKQAEEGIKILKQYVDTLLVISNDKLRHQFGNLKMREAFEKADNVLATAAKCITDVINSTGQINVDFADVCTVMKNGGVAILGSATSSGENRAQRAIEEALNSPLLNDNDIRGAKWILININSAEGDSEFTMDEVEVIQAHLLSQAGENTDVILGLGYDNSLGDEIGITLIATGFENKDPFVKPVLKKEEQDEGKIVMTLTPQQNTAPKIEAKVEKPEVIEHELKEAEKSLGLQVDPMMPKLIDEPVFVDAPMPTLEDMADLGYGKETATVHYSLSTEDNEKIGVHAEPEPEVVPEVVVEVVAAEEEAFYSPSVPAENRVMEEPVINEQDLSAGVGVRSYLEKPSNIYAEQKREEAVAKAPVPDPVPEEKMELVEKVDLAKEEVKMPQSNIERELPVQQQPQLSQEEEMQLQKRKQVERLQKLRNLSFNVNGSDPNNEYETVPAYIRRNMELQDNSNHIESYYSKFEISSDDKNQGQINTINTFLDGKKPD